ncbi:DegT/DnrJ/EryC1/StrS family aminotransferase [Candidatus Daviesbacteria bacterium]|nr:DegT/DnrJ/EryC1/StrS family aminotransferase [Candidatus Daviesbacteria bacterium]
MLEQRYGGQVLLFYKAREALKSALMLLGLDLSATVAVCGFTCYVVYQAVTEAGLKVEYLDIADGGLNFTASQLEERLKTNPSIKVVIIQNTLGYPCEIREIKKLCVDNQLILIEDLAHSAGLVYLNGQEAGTMGDLAVLSFSQDKIIDGISGGALIIRNKKLFPLFSIKFTNLNLRQQLLDRMYPMFTFLIRNSYDLAIGKILHLVLKQAGWLSSTINTAGILTIHSLPFWYCYLIKLQMEHLDMNLKHRREIARIYTRYLDKKMLSSALISQINNSTHVRFPILVDKRDSLITYLTKRGIHLADIWYDAPIAPGKYLQMTNYQSQCPVAEKISSRIVNLPTHGYVSGKYARRITNLINQWQLSQ